MLFSTEFLRGELRLNVSIRKKEKDEQCHQVVQMVITVLYDLKMNLTGLNEENKRKN